MECASYMFWAGIEGHSTRPTSLSPSQDAPKFQSAPRKTIQRVFGSYFKTAGERGQEKVSGTGKLVGEERREWRRDGMVLRSCGTCDLPRRNR